MITLFRNNKIYSLKEAKQKMAKQIRDLPNKVSYVGTPQKLFRFEFICEPIDLLSWLHNQSHEHKVYWSDRNAQFEMAGIGIAHCLKGEKAIDYTSIFENLEDRLSSDNPHLRYYGGFNFNDSKADDQWRSFGTYHFSVPQFEIYKEEQKIFFAFNIDIQNINKEDINHILQNLEKIDFNESTHYRKVPQIIGRKDIPDNDNWKQIFKDLKTKEGSFQFEKIVLARKSIFSFDVSIRPSALIKHLKDKTPNCYHFCYQTNEHTAFLGASPEQLYKKVHNNIESEAIAGTVQRGESESEDNKLAQELLKSDKNAREHRYVVNSIKKALGALCSTFEADNNFSLLSLKEGHHLITRFRGKLLEQTDNGKIVSSLHPTPAVCGIPVDQVSKAIKTIEPFSRGWYAAPIGYVGNDTTEFAVAIRSGLVHENTLSLFAGAGIVEGSCADEEYNEIEAKMSRFLKVFKE